MIATKILLFIDSDIFAGTERHLLELARALRLDGLTMSIACPSASPLARLAQNEFQCIAIEKRGLLDFRAILTLRRLLAAEEVSVVHAHNGRTALIAALAGWLARKGAVVATQHFIDPAHATRIGWRAFVSRLAHRWVQRQTRQFIAVSAAAGQAMLARERSLVDKITVIPNGIATPVTATLVPVEEIRQAFRLSHDTRLIVCVARLAEEKDVATLVAAMGPVTAQIPDVHCVIVGDGPQRAALEAQISQVSWGRHITLAGFREDAISVIRAADLFVLPSRAEPFGLVLIEAMSLGKAVVAVAAGGPLEIVKDEETGLLVPPGDATALAAAISTLVSDPDRRTAMGAAASLRFEECFTARVMARATKEVYRRAMSQSPQTARTTAEPQCESC